MYIAANNDYEISGFVYDNLIGSFGNFVFLFMVISSFGMCSGYYDTILNNKLSLSLFYAKRFKKVLPFFSILVILDVCLSPSLNSLYEAFADLTLLFGFLSGTKEISVIGVGWFLGLIFVFYVSFPFFCVLIENRKRAWFAFAISLIYNFVCTQYFDVGRGNILYSSCYFIAGGLIYLYLDKIEQWNQWLSLIFVILSIILYYSIGFNTLTMLYIFLSFLVNLIFHFFISKT